MTEELKSLDELSVKYGVTPYWLHKKMPADAKPLTREWYKKVTTPTFDENTGEIYRQFTPPYGEEPTLPLGGMIGYGIVGAIGLGLIIWIIIGTAPLWMK